MNDRGLDALNSHDGTPSAPPRGLRLEFSNAAGNAEATIADYARLMGSIYSPETRRRADPSGNVIERDPETFYDAVSAHRIAFLSDADDSKRIVAATAAYKSPGMRCAEIGSTLKDLPAGFDGGKLVVAAATLSEAMRRTVCLVAAIGRDNDRGRQAYADLGWKPVTEPKRIRQLFEITRKPLPKASKVWVECDDRTLKIQARFIQDVIDQGGLTNKITGEFLPVDMSGLITAGLTPRWLQFFIDQDTPGHNALPSTAAPL